MDSFLWAGASFAFSIFVPGYIVNVIFVHFCCTYWTANV